MSFSKLSILSGIFALSAAAVVPTTVVDSDFFHAQSKPPALKPIRAGRPRSSIGNSPSPSLVPLEPAPHVHMVYAAPDKDDVLLANMTLYADDSPLLVMMEDFDGLTSSVDCNDNDGFLGLTFKSKSAYDYALKKWAFINDNEEASFVMITNHDGCGPDDERAPYNITKVETNAATSSVKLTAALAEWKDIARTFEIDFGKASNPQQSLEKRCGVLSYCTYDTSVLVPLSIGQENTPISLYHNNSLDITCSDCFVGGGFTLEGRISAKLTSINEFSLTINPASLRAALEVTADAHYSSSTSKVVTLIPSTAIPGAGISIPGILTLGAVAGLEAGFSITVDAELTITAGLLASIPNTAQLKVDLANLGSSGASGWEQTKITPVFNLDASVDVNGFVYLAPIIGLEASVLDGVLGAADIAFAIHLPQIDLGASAGIKSSGGFCPNSPQVAGVDLKAAAEIDVELDVTGSIKGLFSKTTTQPLVSATIYSTETCFPFGPSAGVTTSTTSATSTIPTLSAPSTTSTTSTQISITSAITPVITSTFASNSNSITTTI